MEVQLRCQAKHSSRRNSPLSKIARMDCPVTGYLFQNFQEGKKLGVTHKVLNGSCADNQE